MFASRLLRRAALLAALLPLLSALSAAAAPAPYTMTVRDGYICVRESATGDWVYCSAVRADMLSQRDQLLLETGIALQNRAEFTSAVEDFCS